MKSRDLAVRALTYQYAGHTAPASEEWLPPAGWRAFERTVVIGSGSEVWRSASESVLAWGIKTRSGFTVEPVPRDRDGGAVEVGDRFWLVANLWLLRVKEPVEIVATVVSGDRCGFAYGTLDGHPVVGEEAFVVHRGVDGEVLLTLRSLTRAGRELWWFLFPLVLVAQRLYRRRYLRALADRA